MQLHKRKAPHVKRTGADFTVEEPFLFVVPEQMSPKRAWYQAYKVRVALGKCRRIEAVGSFPSRADNTGWVARNAFGDTEDEAVANLARAAGVPLWFEEEFVRSREGLAS